MKEEKGALGQPGPEPCPLWRPARHQLSECWAFRQSDQPSRPSDMKQVPQVPGRRSCDARDPMAQGEKAGGDISGKRSACAPQRANQPSPSHGTSSPGAQPQAGRAGPRLVQQAPTTCTHRWPRSQLRVSAPSGGAGSGELIGTSHHVGIQDVLLVPDIGHGGSAIPQLPAAQQVRAPLAGPRRNISLQHWFWGVARPLESRPGCPLEREVGRRGI